MIEGISNTELEALLTSKQITAACRKGKHLWLDFDTGPSVMFHFGTRLTSSVDLLMHWQAWLQAVSLVFVAARAKGMTGSMVVKGVAAARYRTFVVDEEQWPPKFWKVRQAVKCKGIQKGLC